MVQAAASALLGAFSGQSRREISPRSQPESALPAIASSVDNKRANLIRKHSREERLYNLITQPEVLGFAMALGGLALSNNIPFSSDENKNHLLQGVASVMSVSMGMGYAGVGDLTSLSCAMMAGGASVLPELIDTENLGSTTPSEWYKLIFPFGGLWASLT